MQIDMQEFLKLLTNRQRQPEKVTSCKLKQQPISKEVLEGYSQQLRKIYDHFFNDRKNELQIDKQVPLKIKKTQVPLCNKLFGRAEGVYKCYDCFIHEAAVLCEECFQKGHHEGHRFKRFPSGGGNCDCGNQLALKKQGFCVNHTGTVKRPQISEQERNIFTYIIGHMLEWFFQLLNDKQSFAQTYGQVLIQYLRKLNKQSIFYNLLTHELLTKKSSKGTSCLSQFMKIKRGKMPGVLNELFFQIFALDEFKVALANQFLIAYNTLEEFEKTSFHSLYIQLFANDNVVIDLVKNYKNTIFVTKTYYDEETYLADIHFITSINQKPAFAFYELYFLKNKYVPLSFLNEIEKTYEKQNSMHEVDVVSKYINQQYFFYSLHEDLFAKITPNRELLAYIVKELFLNLVSKKYSYRKNKAILPYHRMYAIGLFALFEGNISQMSVATLSQKLAVEEESIVNFYQDTSSHIINCLLDFSETYGRRNYFDNYIILYVRSGIASIKYDQMFLKEAAHVLKSSNQTFQKILSQKISSNAKIVFFDDDPTALTQFLQKWINFCALMIEIGTTNSCEVELSDKLKLNNNALRKKKSRLFKSIVKKIGQVSRQEIAIIEKYFTGSLNDKFLIENAQFDRTNKKYQAKIDKNQEVKQFLYELYMSKRKIGQTLLKEEDGKSFIARHIKTDQKSQILNIILPKKFVNQIIEFFCQNFNKIEKKKSESIVINLMSLLKKLSTFSSQPYQKEISRVSAYLPEQILPQENYNQSQSLRKELVKKNQNQKKARFMMKQQKFLKKYENEICEQKPEDSDLICLLCRDNSNQKQGLSYFSTLKYKSLRSVNMKQKELGFIYDSCFHTAHYECFKKMCKNNSNIQCPLCKSPCNILLPVICDYENSIFQKIVERIRKVIFHMQKYYIHISEEQIINIQFHQFSVFKSMMQSLVEYIGFVGVINQGELKKRFWRVCKEILKFMMREWSTLSGNEKQELYQFMGKYIDGENKNKQLRVNIKHCIVSKIFAHIQGKELYLNKIKQTYGSKISLEDLGIIQQNLCLILDQQQEIEQEIQSENSLPRLRGSYQFYQPPSTVKDLIKQRDEKSSKNCKKGHNVCICCQCQEIACLQCNTIKSHNKLHGSEAVYFGLLTGGLTVCITKKITIPSLYENRLGVSWTSQKQPEGFELNSESYEQILGNLIIHSIEDYLRKKMPKLLDTAQGTEILLFNDQ